MTNVSALIVPPPSQAAAKTNAEPAFQNALKPIIAIPNFWLWVIWGAVILAAGILGWLLWRYWRKRAAKLNMPPPVPPHIHARRMLEHALSLISEPKPFTIAVSGTIRIYLEQRFNFHAPDRTTEEFLHELQGTRLLTVEQKQSLAEFLERCDLIKFAKYEPTEMELRGLHAAALRLVNETEPRPEPAAPAPEMAGATK